mgnify:CR=1 FL=1
MAESIFYIILLLLSLLGLTNIIWSIALWMNGNKNCVKPFLVVPLDNSCKEIEATLRNAISRAELMSASTCAGILAVDLGLEEESLSCCRDFCESYDGVRLCTPAELSCILSASMQEDGAKSRQNQ